MAWRKVMILGDWQGFCGARCRLQTLCCYRGYPRAAAVADGRSPRLKHSEPSRLAVVTAFSLKLAATRGGEGVLVDAEAGTHGGADGVGAGGILSQDGEYLGDI